MKDFKTFSKKGFTGLSVSARRELRDVVRRQGVFVKKGYIVSIHSYLYEIVRDDVP